MKIVLKDGVTKIDVSPLKAKFYVLKRGAKYIDESQDAMPEPKKVKETTKANKPKKVK